MGAAIVGETISYTFRVVNVGNATATDVHLDDSMFGGPITCTPSTLKPAPSLAEIGKGDTATCGTHTHTVTEADINAPEQFVHNSAVATGKNLDGGPVHSLPSVADVPLNRPTPTIGKLVLTKTASSATVTAGDTLTYTLTVTNTGDTLLAGTVTDDLSDVLDDATLSGTPGGLRRHRLGIRDHADLDRQCRRGVRRDDHVRRHGERLGRQRGAGQHGIPRAAGRVPMARRPARQALRWSTNCPIPAHPSRTGRCSAPGSCWPVPRSCWAAAGDARSDKTGSREIC